MASITLEQWNEIKGILQRYGWSMATINLANQEIIAFRDLAQITIAIDLAAEPDVMEKFVKDYSTYQDNGFCCDLFEEATKKGTDGEACDSLFIPDKDEHGNVNGIWVTGSRLDYLKEDMFVVRFCPFCGRPASKAS
jgi:hypothetical protein